MHRQKGAAKRAPAQRRAPSVRNSYPRPNSGCAEADPSASASHGPEWVVRVATTVHPNRYVLRHDTAEPPSCHRRRSLICILMNSVPSSSDCDDDCAELSANLKQSCIPNERIQDGNRHLCRTMESRLFHRALTVRERTDIVHSHIGETTHEMVQTKRLDLQRALELVFAGSGWRRCQWSVCHQDEK